MVQTRYYNLFSRKGIIHQRVEHVVFPMVDRTSTSSSSSSASFASSSETWLGDISAVLRGKGSRGLHLCTFWIGKSWKSLWFSNVWSSPKLSGRGWTYCQRSNTYNHFGWTPAILVLTIWWYVWFLTHTFGRVWSLHESPILRTRTHPKWPCQTVTLQIWREVIFRLVEEGHDFLCRCHGHSSYKHPKKSPIGLGNIFTNRRRYFAGWRNIPLGPSIGI